MTTQDAGFLAALAEARLGLSEGGVPIGSALVSSDGTILGRGHNQRVQRDSAILHAEIACLSNAGRLHPAVYAGATLYTTLSPCDMCTGAALLYKIPRIVVGENESFLSPGEELLKKRGVEVVVLQSGECMELMKVFMGSERGRRIWGEDIGVQVD